MGKIVISTNVSLDGVVQDPDGEEGFRPGRLVRPVRGQGPRRVGQGRVDEALGAEALLLGRRSDEWFAARWASRSGEWADRLNSLPKYVVSSTLEDPEWTNATVLRGDVVDEVTRLKQELDGDIVVYASYQLGRTLIEHDLVDELRLFVFPVVLGAGERLFGETSDKKPMRLVDSRTVGDGLAFLTYEIVRAPSYRAASTPRRALPRVTGDHPDADLEQARGLAAPSSRPAQRTDPSRRKRNPQWKPRHTQTKEWSSSWRARRSSWSCSMLRS